MGRSIPVHAPPEYRCPLCALARGKPLPDGISTASDLVASNRLATAALSAYQWPNNPGNVIVFPAAHYENLFSLPASAASAVHALAKRIAIAMKAAWRCDGVSTRQHNEPAGNQDVWHFHLHVTPRFQGDEFYSTLGTGKYLMKEPHRKQLALQLRQHLPKP